MNPEVALKATDMDEDQIRKVKEIAINALKEKK